MKSTDDGKGCIAIEGDREKDGANEERERETKSRLLTVREPPPVLSLSFPYYAIHIAEMSLLVFHLLVCVYLLY